MCGNGIPKAGLHYIWECLRELTWYFHLGKILPLTFSEDLLFNKSVSTQKYNQFERKNYNFCSSFWMPFI
jgi:hypothetical protein